MGYQSDLEKLYYRRYKDFLHNPDALYKDLERHYAFPGDKKPCRLALDFIELLKKGCFRLIATYPNDEISVYALIEMKSRCLEDTGPDNIALCDMAETTGRVVLYDTPQSATFLYPFEKKCRYGKLVSPVESMKAYYKQGVEQLKQGQIEEGLQTLDEAAKAGSVEAGLRLGKIYFFGKHVEENSLRGLYYYFLAAMHGSAKAAYNLGLCYSRGIGVLRDVELAETYLMDALKGGVLEAEEELQYLKENPDD